MEGNEIVLPDLTPEQEEAFIVKKYGVASDQLVKKADIPKTLSPEEIAEEEENLRKEKLSTALQQGWIKTSQFEEFQQLKDKGEIELARLQFIEENSDLGEKAGEIFDDMLAINEEDELTEMGTENKVPNVKKQAAGKLAKKLAGEYMRGKFGDVMGIDSKYASFQEQQKNAKEVELIIDEIPEVTEVTVLGQKYTYKITPDDKKVLKQKFKDDKGLLSRKIDRAEVTENGLAYIQTKNFTAILEEIVTAAVSANTEAIKRGEAGIVVGRPDQSGDGLSPKMRAMQETGLLSKQT